MSRLLLTLLLVAFVPLANADYASCILENMKGVGSDVAAGEIKEACQVKYVEKKEILVTSSDTPVQAELSPEDYLANFKTAHDTAVAFANAASTTDAMKAVELTLSMFASDLPETEEDDALADSLIALLKNLNHNWLKSDFPNSFKGLHSFGNGVQIKAYAALAPDGVLFKGMLDLLLINLTLRP